MRFFHVTRTNRHAALTLGSLGWLALCSLALPIAAAAPRPSLVNTRIGTPFGGNGHTSSLDGRIFVANVREDHASTTTTWLARVFRPEAVTYDGEGRPSFASAFSNGRGVDVRGGENALAFCFANPSQPYSLSAGQAVYQPQIFDSQMFNGPNRFRRRSADLRVDRPFQRDAEISSFTTGPVEYLTTTTGASLRGIEPTITADGRLMLFQGAPANDGNIDHLMYTYNPNPCAAAGWSPPRPLSMMYNDPTPGLKRYPLSWKRLKAATGEDFADTTRGELIRAAYVWVDPEGRDVVYVAAPFTDGARREAVSLIGADTNYTAYHIDGSINTDRSDHPHLFYSGPMWNFEQERSGVQTLPPGRSNESQYLPVTKTHDVLSLFGSNTNDYNEVDVAELTNPFYLLFLPMNELVTRAGTYDLRRTPELSGRFFTGSLVGTAQIAASAAITQPHSGSLWAPHGKGKALLLPGGGAVTVNLADPSSSVPGVGAAVSGFTVQLFLRPDADINRGCGGNPYRYLLQKNNAIDLIYEADNTVQLSLQLNGRRLRLGRSPALPVGQWTHLAYTWDGVSGQFAEYINGVPSGRSLPSETGSFRLGTGTLSIGAGVAVNSETCPSSGEGSFRGAIDDVQIFSHARSNRSICITTHGAGCSADAVKKAPSAGQFILNQQQPACASGSALGGIACATAMHRVCAQRGAIDSLASTRNLAETIRQLISNRPPISLSGVPTGLSGNDATIACTPLYNHSLAVTFAELAQRHGGCSDDRAVSSLDCLAASHRFCNDHGFSSGQIFELTTRPWVSCWNSDLIEDVSKDRLGPACGSGNFTSTEARIEISRYCQARGFGSGVIQELGAGTVAHIHCFQPAATATWRLRP
ncbi:MAG: LamG domain-containing protein [Myxococcales bacterium]|nr:LamG domain-containing protein [Myxococcales bacterium]